MTVFLVLIIIVVLFGLYLMSTYNKLVRMRNGAEEAFKTINVYLKQRYDLIPNLVNTIKGYTQYESGTLEKSLHYVARLWLPVVRMEEHQSWHFQEH